MYGGNKGVECVVLLGGKATCSCLTRNERVSHHPTCHHHRRVRTYVQNVIFCKPRTSNFSNCVVMVFAAHPFPPTTIYVARGKFTTLSGLPQWVHHTGSRLPSRPSTSMNDASRMSQQKLEVPIAAGSSLMKMILKIRHVS